MFGNLIDFSLSELIKFWCIWGLALHLLEKQYFTNLFWSSNVKLFDCGNSSLNTFDSREITHIFIHKKIVYRQTVRQTEEETRYNYVQEK